jgi:molecular chaperone GrpE
VTSPSTPTASGASPQEPTGPVVRDKRRIDPETGRVREQAAAASPAAPPPYESLFGGSASSTAAQPAAAPPAPAEEAVATVAAENAEAARAAKVAAATKAYATTSAATAPPAAQQPPVHPQPPAPAPASAPEQSAAEEDPATQLAERTADLQRVTAEYANYRRRMEREREALKQQAIAGVATTLLPLLDDIDRAREHGDLTGGFKSVGEALEQNLQRLGVVKFGQPGDAFDPNIHEAMMHTHSDEVSETTAVQILLAGYTMGERLLRPARVAVADPTPQQPTPGQ